MKHWYLWFFAGCAAMYVFTLALDIISTKFYPRTPLGNCQYKIMSWALRVMGISKVYDPKMRALRVFMLATKLAKATGVPLHATSTALALYYSEPVDKPDGIIGELAIATVLAAHVQRVDLGAEIVRRIQLLHDTK